MTFGGRGANYNFSLKGANRTLKKLTRFPKRLRRDIDKLLATGAEDVADDAAANSPIDRGELAKNWRVEKLREMEYKVYNPSKQAAPMETGFKLKRKSRTGWRVIRIKDPSSKYFPILILDERIAHPKAKPEGYRMLEDAFVKNRRRIVKKTTGIVRRSFK
jgi:hypothetical protein